MEDLVPEEGEEDADPLYQSAYNFKHDVKASGPAKVFK